MSQFPNPSLPNDVIAPHWVPAYELNGYVRYRRGGTAPNRWFVVEWNRLTADCGGDDVPEEYTFEVILHEDGDITFQYKTMSASGCRMCESSGIEDSSGIDGLSTTNFCEAIGSNHAVGIYRPAPSARVGISSLYYGEFTRAGETISFDIPIRNTGDLGTDTYDVTVSTSWPLSLYDAAGDPLTDTDNDGTIDTASVSQGSSATLTAKVETPAGATLGDNHTAVLTVRSSLDTSKDKTVRLQTAVPASFAQALRDSVDGEMSLYLAQPGTRVLKQTTSDSHWGYDMAVAEMPNSFAYFWTQGRSEGNLYVREIEYTLLDSSGDTVRNVGKLTNHTQPTVYIYDYTPVVAVAPNGHIGVLWYRYRYNNSSYANNYNIYYAILNASGSVIVPPTNLTNNPYWGSG